MSNNNDNQFAVVVNVHEAKLFLLDAMLEEAEAKKQARLLAACTKYGPVVRDHATRVGNVENMDDIIAECYEHIIVIASFPHMFAQDEVSYIKAVRNANGGDPLHATPFSRMGSTNNDMEDVPFDDEVVAEDSVEQFSLDDVMHDVLVELESEDLRGTSM
jgi:hypothetical protein